MAYNREEVINYAPGGDSVKTGIEKLDTDLTGAFTHLNTIAATAASTYAPIAKGVTNGDTHDHSGGDGGTIAYSSLSGIDGDKGDITVSGSGATWTVESVAGNLAFLGTAVRIRGDFSNATIANRAMFQTSTVDGNTSVFAVPNGTAKIAQWLASNAADPTNASLTQLVATATESQIMASRLGTGIYLPMTFYTGGAQRLNLATDGTFTSISGAIGYGTGAGGTVTQATSKSTAVTLNKPCGQITMHNAALAAGDSVNFQFNNNLITATDGLLVTPSNNFKYDAKCIFTAEGYSGIRVTNFTGGSLSEALVINFQVIKGAIS